MPNANPTQKIVMTLEDIQAVLNYLSTRPYSEVFQVVEVLKRSRTYEVVAAEEAAKTATTLADTTTTEAPQASA